MGGSGSPLLQSPLILDLGEEAELSGIYLKRDNLSERGQGRREILVEVTLVIVKYCMAFRRAFVSPKCFFLHIFFHFMPMLPY